MITQTASIKKQTAFRLDEKLIERVRKAAAKSNISMNEFVTLALEEATHEFFLAEMEEESRRKTAEFINRCCGVWSDDTADEILTAIHANKTSSPAPEL